MVFILGVIAGVLTAYLIQHLKKRRLELWQLNDDAEIKERYLEKFSEVHKLLSEIAAGTKSRYSKPAKAIISYIESREESCQQ